ncbi:DUF6154 family protein [Alkalihalobacterium alkalinitrilicum]|uniref:DUF6154 family protein n=1 Tax=Alkalihalobacterium alkalinitrilicum TaxID=427920 RepID=UPI0009957981|nr:DUF6154 family protein [Alkalihalobacterium alkalinitrilicum]
MKFVDDLYTMYKNHLTGDEEDALIIIDGILQEISEAGIEKLIHELSDDERFEMFGMYLYEKFQLKISEEGIGQTTNEDDQGKGYVH